MAQVTGGSPNSVAGRSAPRRSALLQTRSRDTRRRLIRAALELWNERGFENAFEETTAEEIARAAGVSKGTFYFHFAHKEDILLEM
nr:helix-turn-helix domain-containing protein [Micromonospora sp. DSM 115978]